MCGFVVHHIFFPFSVLLQIRYFSNIPMTSPVVRVALSFIISFSCISIRGWNQGIISGPRVESRDHLGFAGGIKGSSRVRGWNQGTILVREWNQGIILVCGWNQGIILVCGWNQGIILVRGWNQGIISGSW